MKGRVVIAATLDTKSVEIGHVVGEFERNGIATLVIDCGVLGEPGMSPAISREAVARSGGADIASLRAANDRAAAMRVMAAGLKVEVARLVATGAVAGFYGIGGGTNAAFAAAAFEVIPFGIPKMLVSTIAAGDTRPFVGIKDVVLVHTIVDILGLNAFSRGIIRQSVAGLAGMLNAGDEDAGPQAAVCVGVTAFGATTAAAQAAGSRLEAEGLEVLTFHARGNGGRALETLVAEGRIQAVLDLTTTEIADEIVGGICSAGPDRLLAATARGLPQVVLPGAVDIVNFGPPHTVPERFSGRNLVSHTPNATLMRTTPDENRKIAEFIANRLNGATGPVAVLLPLRGFSDYDRAGAPFHDPAASEAFVSALTGTLRPGIQVVTIDAHINDPEVSAQACDILVDMIRKQTQERKNG